MVTVDVEPAACYVNDVGTPSERRSEINVCCVCMADGVLDVGGAWYCQAHMHHGLHAVAETIVLLATPKMSIGPGDFCDIFDEVLDEYGYTWPADEREDEDEDE